MKQTIAEPTIETPALMKKPRLMADRPLRSLSRGLVAKMPMTAVMTPTMGMASGKIRPFEPKTSLPRISAATRVTA